MTNFQKAAFSFLSVIACFLLGLVIWLWQGKFQQPLGPPLHIPTVTALGLPATWTPDPNETRSASIGTLQTTPNPASIQAASPLPTITQSAGVCGAPPVLTILAVGTDARANNYVYGLGDVIRLVRIDSVTPRITVLEFPRDLWVQIPDIADNLDGQNHEKLNQAYLYGNRGFGYTNDPAQGPGLLARTMALNFGAQIDHYAAVNMRTFVNIVNAVDGIDIFLPKAVDGRTADDTSSRLLFPAGQLHLDGARALTLARIRIAGGFARAENQNRVLCALRSRLTSPTVITKIPDLIKSFQGAIQTDLSPAQIGQLACIGSQVQPGNLVFLNFPEQYFKQSRMYDPLFNKKVFVWDVDYDVLRKYVSLFNAGTWVSSAVTSAKEEESSLCP